MKRIIYFFIFILFIILFIIFASILVYIYKKTSLLLDINNQIITKNNIIDELNKKLEATKNNNCEK